jgi:hypothetical protein
VFFADVPDLWTLAGMALITTGGLGVLMIQYDANRPQNRGQR